jgi:hypothetical protein
MKQREIYSMAWWSGAMLITCFMSALHAADEGSPFFSGLFAVCTVGYAVHGVLTYRELPR